MLQKHFVAVKKRGILIYGTIILRLCWAREEKSNAQTQKRPRYFLTNNENLWPIVWFFFFLSSPDSNDRSNTFLFLQQNFCSDFYFRSSCFNNLLSCSSDLLVWNFTSTPSSTPWKASQRGLTRLLWLWDVPDITKVRTKWFHRKGTQPTNKQPPMQPILSACITEWCFFARGRESDT